MKLPFQKVKTYTTSFSANEVLHQVDELINKKSKFLFISSNDYTGSIESNSFNFYKNYNINAGPANPKISGIILDENPTTIEIKISPHYGRVLFFMIFPCFFIPTAIFISKMTINGVVREPEVFERIAFGLFGGAGPMIWCYFDSIRPMKKAESWIKDKLMLKEII